MNSRPGPERPAGLARNGVDRDALAHGRHIELVVIAASAGGIKALETILGALPADFAAPIAVVQHRSTHLPNYLAEVLGRHTPLKVKFAIHTERMRAGTVYVAPPEYHLTVDRHLGVALRDGRRIRHVLSSANPLFESAAAALDGHVVAVVLTGYGSDATDGVQAIRAHGGIVLAQDRATAETFDMPQSAIATGCVDCVLPLSEIAPTLRALVKANPQGGGAGFHSPPILHLDEPPR